MFKKLKRLMQDTTEKHKASIENDKNALLNEFKTHIIDRLDVNNKAIAIKMMTEFKALRREEPNKPSPDTGWMLDLLIVVRRFDREVDFTKEGDWK